LSLKLDQTIGEGKSPPKKEPPIQINLRKKKEEEEQQDEEEEVEGEKEEELHSPKRTKKAKVQKTKR